MNQNNTWNIETYNKAKCILLQSINNHNISTIILVGAGGNGKTHLIQETKQYILDNKYNILSPDITYFESQKEFLDILDKVKGKKIMECTSDPYETWNIPKSKEVIIINMNIT